MSVNRTHTKTSRETFWATDTGRSLHTFSLASWAEILRTPHIIGSPENRPFGLFSAVHRMLPWQLRSLPTNTGRSLHMVS